MASLDREIDRLYQLPLSEFTKARDELAKRSEARRGEIRRLQKPNLPAWAVNQLFWHERGTYDALVAASERLRKAQVASLEGKTVDVAKAEREHASARQTATDRIRKILADAGEPLTPATRTAIAETLQALPIPEGASPGYLIRPLKPLGFEALTSLLKGGKIAPRPSTSSGRAHVLPFRKTPDQARQEQRAAETERRRAEERAKREAETRKLDIQKLEREVREKQRAEQQARKALDRARAEADEAEAALSKAAAERRKIEAQLKTLRGE